MFHIMIAVLLLNTGESGMFQSNQDYASREECQAQIKTVTDNFIEAFKEKYPGVGNVKISSGCLSEDEMLPGKNV